MNLTPHEAREQALQSAREAAIQFEVGVEIKTGDYLTQEKRDPLSMMPFSRSAGKPAPGES